MVGIKNHGGGCCGIRHLSSFRDKTPSNIEKLKTAFWQVPRRRLVEVVLRVNQAKVWGNILAGLGFIPVGKFINGNTKNRLYVFWYYSGKMDVTPLDVASLPFSFNAGIGKKELDNAPSNDPTIYANDLVRVNSPRSKWNGRTGKVLCFHTRYRNFRNVSSAVVEIGDPFTGYNNVSIVVSNLKKVLK